MSNKVINKYLTKYIEKCPHENIKLTYCLDCNAFGNNIKFYDFFQWNDFEYLYKFFINDSQDIQLEFIRYVSFYTNGARMALLKLINEKDFPLTFYCFLRNREEKKKGESIDELGITFDRIK
jgi:hypothetical protein